MESKQRRSVAGRRAGIIGVSALSLVALAALPGYADVVRNEVVSSGGVENQLQLLEGQTASVLYYVKATGGTCDAADGSALTISIDAPSGLTATPSSLRFTSCDTRQSVLFGATAPGTYDIPAVRTTDTVGTYSTGPTALKVKVSGDKDRDGVADGLDNCPTTANAGQADSDGDNIGDACDTATPPVNKAPVVAVAANDATGNEGDSLTTSGRFSDPDGDLLALTANPSVGQFADNGDGSWTWRLATDDDVALASISVTADDGKGGSAQDAFDYSAANVAPKLSLSANSGDAFGCSVNMAGGWNDPGVADTHSGGFVWADGGSSALGTENPFTVGRSFTNAGTYAATATLADDDGGSDTRTVEHRVFNKPSTVMQPITGTGTGAGTPRLFKLGSTIPVKITVSDCAGAAVSSLAPTVSLVKIDNSPDGTSVETVSTANPTAGTNMRYSADGQLYIYNLGTKGLTAGDYRVKISDPTFPSVVIAGFGIK